MKAVTKYEADDGSIHDTKDDAMVADRKTALLSILRHSFMCEHTTHESIVEWMANHVHAVRQFVGQPAESTPVSYAKGCWWQHGKTGRIAFAHSEQYLPDSSGVWQRCHPPKFAYIEQLPPPPTETSSAI